MNYPPAPVFGGDQMAPLSVHQASSIEEWNRNAGDEEEREQGAVLALANQRRLERSHHQYKPQNQADEQKYLPESSQVDIFISLAAEPEPHVAEALLNAHPFTGKRAADHKDQCAEEYVDAEPLILRLVSSHRGSNIQARCQPRSRDPEDGELQVPRAGHCVGWLAIQGEAIKTVAFDRIVRGQDTHRDLHAPKDHYYEKILHRGALRRCRLDCEEGICGWIGAVNEDLFLRRVPPDHAADSRQQTDDAQNAPEQRSGREAIGDQRLMRPVVGVGGGRVGTLGTGRP